MEANTEALEMLFLLVLGEGVTLEDRLVPLQVVQQAQVLEDQQDQPQEAHQVPQQEAQQVREGEVLSRVDQEEVQA